MSNHWYVFFLSAWQAAQFKLCLFPLGCPTQKPKKQKLQECSCQFPIGSRSRLSSPIQDAACGSMDLRHTLEQTQSLCNPSAVRPRGKPARLHSPSLPHWRILRTLKETLRQAEKQVHFILLSKLLTVQWVSRGLVMKKRQWGNQSESDRLVINSSINLVNEKNKCTTFLDAFYFFSPKFLSKTWKMKVSQWTHSTKLNWASC